MAWHGTVFRSQMQFWPCKAAHEQYNAGDSRLKKEIPVEEASYATRPIQI